MLPFLAVLGGAAACELKNVITGDRDVERLRMRETLLKDKLLEAEQKLDEERSKVDEAVEARQRVEQQNEQLINMHKLMADSEAKLREQQEQLQQARDRLIREKLQLTQQLQAMQLGQERMLLQLKQQVGRAIELFAQGQSDSTQLLGTLSALGVELSADMQLPRLTAHTVASAGEDASASLVIEQAWEKPLQLVLDDPHRLRLLAAAGATARAAGLIMPNTSRPALLPASPRALMGPQCVRSSSWLSRAVSVMSVPQRDNSKTESKDSVELKGKENKPTIVNDKPIASAEAAPNKAQALMVTKDARNTHDKLVKLETPAQVQPKNIAAASFTGKGTAVPRLQLKPPAAPATRVENTAAAQKGTSTSVATKSTQLLTGQTAASVLSSNKQMVAASLLSNALVERH